MFFLIYLSTLLILISSILLSINLMISKKKMKNREKNSSFECGFDPMSNPRIPFSIQFFLISLMFLIFDIEIALLIPLIYSFFKFNFFMILTFLIFMLILILSLYIEINENMLEWKFKI